MLTTAFLACNGFLDGDRVHRVALEDGQVWMLKSKRGRIPYKGRDGVTRLPCLLHNVKTQTARRAKNKDPHFSPVIFKNSPES